MLFKMHRIGSFLRRKRVIWTLCLGYVQRTLSILQLPAFYLEFSTAGTNIQVEVKQNIFRRNNIQQSEVLKSVPQYVFR